jgi:hypothetical protein
MNNPEAKPASVRLPMWWLWIVLSLLTVALGTVIRISAPGWLLIIFGLGLCGLMVVHPIVHAMGALKGGQYRRGMPKLLALSNLSFVLGFGFQVDFGDTPGGYMGFQNFAHEILGGSGEVPTVPGALENLYFGLAVGSLIALIASWVAIMILALRKPKVGAIESAVGEKTA